MELITRRAAARNSSIEVGNDRYEVERLWRRCSTIVQADPVNMTAARTLWCEWLPLFLPDDRTRAVIPLPRLLLGSQ
jgi:hypothetical protein